MTSAIYRKAMLTAFSVPACLFVALPLAAVALLAPWDSSTLFGALGMLAALLVPPYLVGWALAPRCGPLVAMSKAPSFLMAGAAGASSALTAGVLAATSGSVGAAAGIAGFVAIFALPASLLGGLLFIGACQQIQTNARQSGSQA